MNTQSINPQPANVSPLNNSPNRQPQPTRPDSTKPHGHNSLTFILILSCVALTIVSLILGIVNLVQFNQLYSTLEETGTLKSGADLISEQDDIISCTIPTSVEDIDYLFLSQSNPERDYFIDSDNSIDYTVIRTNSANEPISSNHYIKTDTSDIFQSLFNNGLGDFASYTERDTGSEPIDWNWIAQIDNTDSSSCQARGNGLPPEWFNNLINLIDEKINNN